MVKHPESSLQHHFKAAVHFELDYAEFLDEALIDAWDLNESLVRNDMLQGTSNRREWWILKPDGGNGIRLFSSLDELRAIFEEWDMEEEEDYGEDEKDDNEISDAGNKVFHERSTSEVSEGRRNGNEPKSGAMISQLRHFIAQPYIHPPLLIESKGNKKFHIRERTMRPSTLQAI